jgi:cytochrome c oxidase subunit 2
VGAIVVGLALAYVGVAVAGNGGIAPPSPESPNAGRISDAYWLILGFTGFVFVLVEGALIAFIVKYRSRGRGRDVEGPQIRGNTRLELIWTVFPVVLLAAIAGFVFYKLPGIQDVPKASAAGGQERVQVIGHQFYWEFRYPNGAVSIDELHAPIDRVVRLDIRSYDVDHSWWVPELGGKFDAIPGRVNHTWFQTRRAGTYRGQCGEFCGIFHAVMEARVLVEPQAAYQSFITTGAKAGLGKALWTGACAKCHGIAGQGDYGPKIAGNATLADPTALKTLLRNGRNTQTPGVMPPVGRNWTDAEFNALIQYIQKNVGNGG